MHEREGQVLRWRRGEVDCRVDCPNVLVDSRHVFHPLLSYKRLPSICV